MSIRDSGFELLSHLEDLAFLVSVQIVVFNTYNLFVGKLLKILFGEELTRRFSRMLFVPSFGAVNPGLMSETCHCGFDATYESLSDAKYVSNG